MKIIVGILVFVAVAWILQIALRRPKNDAAHCSELNDE